MASRKSRRPAKSAVNVRHKGALQAEPARDSNWANLDPAFKARLAATLSALSDRGTPFKLVEGFRTVERQQWLYGSGRPTAVPFGRPGPVVTQRDGVKRLSNHQGSGVPGTGHGADCYPTNNGKVFIPPASHPLWEQYAGAAEEQGLVAGQHWQTFKDSPHVELPPTRNAAELQKLVRELPLPAATRSVKASRKSRGAPAPTDSLELPAPPVSLADKTAQALVAGSGLILAEEGVSAQVKQDITYCTLFAQFKATSVVSPSADIVAWYEAYFAALQTLGWVMTSQSFRDYSLSGTGVEVHKAILGVLAVALGPAAATLAVAKSVLDGLEQIGSDNGWLTLFHKQSVHSNLASFQIVTAVPQPNGMVGLGLVAFSLKAKDDVTQVLFFKLKKNKASLKYAGGTAAIEESVLAMVRDALKTRLQDAAKDFVSSVPIPGH